MTEIIVPNKNPIRLLTAGYVLALVIIALMSGFIHVYLNKISEQQNSSAVFVSARQGKTAQQIALYATLYIEKREPLVRQELSDAIEAMEISHQALLKGSRDMNIPPAMNENVRAVFFGQPFSLDKKVEIFLAEGKAFLAGDPQNLGTSNPHYRYIVDAMQGPLRDALDAAVMAYENDSLRQIERFQSYQRYALFIIFMTLIAEALFIFMPLVRRVNDYAEMLRQLATTDGLTTVDNYRSFMQKGVRELRRSQRIGKPLCVCLIDIDHFKSVNDQYGHNTGDIVLRQFADTVKKCMRLEDEIGRIGGEEFGVLLPHTRLSDALRVAERIRRMIEITAVRHGENKDLFITSSIGVAEANPKSPTLEHVLAAADEALYKAKQNGRNRVEISSAFSTEAAATVISMEREQKSMA